MPQWEQTSDGVIRNYRPDISIPRIELRMPTRRGSLFDMSYAALTEQAERPCGPLMSGSVMEHVHSI